MTDTTSPTALTVQAIGKLDKLVAIADAIAAAGTALAGIDRSLDHAARAVELRAARCDRCAHWHAVDSTVGQCREDGPGLAGVELDADGRCSSTAHGWPLTHATLACGRYLRRAPDPKAQKTV